LERLRRLEAMRIKKSAGGLASALREMTLSMSFVDDLHPFYRELLLLSVGTAQSGQRGYGRQIYLQGGLDGLEDGVLQRAPRRLVAQEEGGRP
jgi:hypothetical protein